MSQTMEWVPSDITHAIDVTYQLMNASLGNYIVAKLKLTREQCNGSLNYQAKIVAIIEGFNHGYLSTF